MITHHEARPGNWVKQHLTGQFVQLDWPEIRHICQGNVQAAFYDNRPVYEGIPLTPEILEKWVGARNPFGDTWTYGFNPVNNNILLVIEKSCSGFYFFQNALHRLDYLHQLQNLWAVLTSTELMVKVLPIRK